MHVEYLARELAPFVDLTVHCQGKPRSTAVAHSPWSLLSESNSALQTLSTDLSMAWPARLVCSRSLATSAVQPVWWLAPRPAPVSPWKYS